MNTYPSLQYTQSIPIVSLAGRICARLALLFGHITHDLHCSGA
jgi:hypothetical protein